MRLLQQTTALIEAKVAVTSAFQAIRIKLKPEESNRVKKNYRDYTTFNFVANCLFLCVYQASNEEHCKVLSGRKYISYEHSSQKQ